MKKEVKLEIYISNKIAKLGQDVDFEYNEILEINKFFRKIEFDTRFKTGGSDSVFKCLSKLQKNIKSSITDRYFKNLLTADFYSQTPYFFRMIEKLCFYSPSKFCIFKLLDTVINLKIDRDKTIKVIAYEYY